MRGLRRKDSHHWRSIQYLRIQHRSSPGLLTRQRYLGTASATAHSQIRPWLGGVPRPFLRHGGRRRHHQSAWPTNCLWTNGKLRPCDQCMAVTRTHANTSACRCRCHHWRLDLCGGRRRSFRRRCTVSSARSLYPLTIRDRMLGPTPICRSLPTTSDRGIIPRMVKKSIRTNFQIKTTAQPSAGSRSARATRPKHPAPPPTQLPPHTSQALEHPTAQQPNTHRPAESKLSFEPVKCTGWGTPSARTPKQLQYATLGLLHEILHGVFFTV